MFKWKRKSANPILSDELRDGKPELVTPLFDIKPKANIHAKMEYLDRLIRMDESKYSLLASEAKHLAERLNEVCDSIERDLGILEEEEVSTDELIKTLHERICRRDKAI